MNLNKDVDTKDDQEQLLLALPYAFYNDATGFSAAVAISAIGYGQEQVAAVVNGFYSSNESSNIFAVVMDYQTPFSERLFIDTQVMSATWGEVDSFQQGNPKFPNEVAGSNDSDKDNFILAEGDDFLLRFTFKYLLDIGDGRGEPIHTFKTRNGQMVDGYGAGGSEWNPFSSGRTTLIFEPFYREQDFEDEFDNQFLNKTSGVKFGVQYDNRDWYKNPSYGSFQSLTVARDWGLQNESSSWTAIQFEYSKYIPLATSEKTRQRVLAFNFWTSDVPTWNSSHTDSSTGQEIFHRAPLFSGSTLGGVDRQRGYPTTRFHDRSAVNYSVEYRHMPDWNPFTTMPILKALPIPWWQMVGFVEIGRVADQYSLNELHTDMKISAGAGIRVAVDELVVRADLAGSEEGVGVQMFIGHIF
ncbi:MAG: BamA/TamA family outer membrane protein [Oceanicoccus sp.]